MRQATVLTIFLVLFWSNVSAQNATPGAAGGMAQPMHQQMQQRMQELDNLVVRIGNENDAGKRQVLVQTFRETMRRNLDTARRMMRQRMQNRAARRGFAQPSGMYPQPLYFGQSWVPTQPGYGGAMQNPALAGGRGQPHPRAGKGKHHREMEAQLDRIEAMLKRLLAQSGESG